MSTVEDVSLYASGSGERDYKVIPKVSINFEAPATGAFRKLSVDLLEQMLKRKLRTLMVSSPVETEASGAVAANLAVSMARLGKRVLLVEADMRFPKVHQYFHSCSSRGIAEPVLGKVSPDAVIRKVLDIPNLSLITHVAHHHDPHEVLASESFRAVLDVYRRTYDCVLLSASPAALASESAALAGMADGVLLVVAAKAADRESMRKTMRALKNVNATVIGAVMSKG